jgi:hypothetical protein
MMHHDTALTAPVPAIQQSATVPASPYPELVQWGRTSGSAQADQKANPLYHIHRKAIYQEAMRVGAQAGLAWEDRVIWARLQGEGHYLDRVWDFSHWIFTVPYSQQQVWVMPPILEQSHEAMHLHNPDFLTVSHRLYRIHAPARLMTSTPRWQSQGEKYPGLAVTAYVRTTGNLGFWHQKRLACRCASRQKQFHGCRVHHASHLYGHFAL